MKTAPERLADLHSLSERIEKAPTTIAGEVETVIKTVFVGALADPNDVVRHEAAFVLGDLKRRGKLEGFSEAIFICLTTSASSDKSVLVRHEAALSLAKWPCEKAVVILSKLCADPAPEVRSSAEYALTEILLRERNAAV